jgi:hypothetical protein
MSRTTMTTTLLLLATLLLSPPGIAAAKKKAAPVRAALVDGQVLFGDLRTETLVLDGELGRLKIPLADVGEVLPIEGEHLGESQGYVRVWLRNGSELVGRWDDPDLAVAIKVGKDTIKVDLPVDQLQRLQTQGGELWPKGAVYRVRTSTGDDFLVDAEESRIALVNQMGTFTPRLSECRSVYPIDDPTGEWRIELHTGTTLIGNLDKDQLELSMALGPKQVTVPLAVMQSIEQQSWHVASPAGGTRGQGSGSGGGLLRGFGSRKSQGQVYYEAPADGPVGAPAEVVPWDSIQVEDQEVTIDAADGTWFRRDKLEHAKQSSR